MHRLLRVGLRRGGDALCLRVRDAFRGHARLLPRRRGAAGVAADPSAFAQVADSLGLDVSERTARRIMDGSIPPLDSLLDRIRAEGFEDEGAPAGGAKAPRRPKPARDARGLKLSAEDAVELKGQVRSAFADIARRYYLEEDVEPVLRVGKNALHITIPVEKLR